MSLSLTCYGGVGRVTGANFMLTNKSSAHILIDCGLVQGERFALPINGEPFGYNPASVHALIITHAHLDHVGRIPKLVREGFAGAIYSTPATRELAELIMRDSLGVLGKEAEATGEPMIYESADVDRTLTLWKSVAYHEETDIGAGFSILLRNAGHILGSASVRVRTDECNVVFTGDLGNSPAPLLPPPEEVTDADYLVTESVYGDRVHEGVEERDARLRAIITESIIRGGALLIPAFSIERTQNLLHVLNNLVEEGKVPSVPVYLDSPMAIAATEIYARHTKYFNEGVQEEIKGGDDIFSFPNLHMTRTTEESKEINEVPNPKIIIAGSGMSNGGRIIHHERRHLSDPHSTLLFVGYQSAGSLGRRLQEGLKSVTIFGDAIPVHARIETLHGYSAHADCEGLLDFISHTSERVRRVFVAMGEPKSSLFLAQRLHDYLGVDAIVPEEGKTYILEGE